MSYVMYDVRVVSAVCMYVHDMYVCSMYVCVLTCIVYYVKLHVCMRTFMHRYVHECTPCIVPL